MQIFKYAFEILVKTMVNTDSPLHTIHIKIPHNITNELEKIYTYISDNYENKYPVQNDWTPHIDIYTIRVKEKNSRQYISKFIQLDLSQFTLSITLTGFSLSNDKKYIFIEPDHQSKKQILKLRDFIDNEIGNYKDLDIPSYFQKNWHRYTNEQKERIKTEGGPYEYIPHISLVKLHPSDSLKAINQIKGLFTPASFNVDEILMNKQTFNRDKMFETVAVKKLNNY